MEPINRVIAAHSAGLLAIEGVVGVYEGSRADGSPCLCVAVATNSPELRARVPAQVAGYPVEIVETGPIGPLA